MNFLFIEPIQPQPDCYERNNWMLTLIAIDTLKRATSKRIHCKPIDSMIRSFFVWLRGFRFSTVLCGALALLWLWLWLWLLAVVLALVLALVFIWHWHRGIGIGIGIGNGDWRLAIGFFVLFE